jgi:uncharacterized membrane protein
MTTSVANVQALLDDPTQTATQLKVIFDKAGTDIVAYLNTVLLPALEENTVGTSGAENIGCGAIAGVTGTRVRAMLEDLKAQIDAAVIGTIPDASITASKMAADMTKDITGGIVSHDTYMSDTSFSTRRDINMHNIYTMGGLI